jgi:hypothetical protein
MSEKKAPRISFKKLPPPPVKGKMPKWNIALQQMPRIDHTHRNAPKVRRKR